MNNERRQDERVEVNLPARWQGVSRSYEGRVVDLSLGGCFIGSNGFVEMGELISVEIGMPSGEWLHLRGEVTSYQTGIGFGLLFTFLTDDEEYSLRQIVT